MKYRINKKAKRSLLLKLLENSVSQLEENNCIYKTRTLRIPSRESKTLKNINGYRLEIRSSREDKHNYAHFHIVKGEEGMASIRIDTLQVIESSLPSKDEKKILKWAQENRDILVETWNEFHGYRILVE